MKCQQYVFLLTSDQLDPPAALSLRLGAALHRTMCRHCRAFTHNDRLLMQAVAEQQAQWLQSLKPPDKS